jgi:hypothetical protein
MLEQTGLDHEELQGVSDVGASVVEGASIKINRSDIRRADIESKRLERQQKRDMGITRWSEFKTRAAQGADYLKDKAGKIAEKAGENFIDDAPNRVMYHLESATERIQDKAARLNNRYDARAAEISQNTRTKVDGAVDSLQRLRTAPGRKLHELRVNHLTRQKERAAEDLFQQTQQRMAKGEAMLAEANMVLATPTIKEQKLSSEVINLETRIDELRSSAQGARENAGGAGRLRQFLSRFRTEAGNVQQAPLAAAT